MPTQTKTTETPEPADRISLYEAARKVLLAGIGAVALAQDEIEDFIDKLVERGEIAEQDGKRLFSEIMDKRKKSTEKAEDEFTKRVEEILDRMNVPTKDDINKLGQKITNLTKKVDELKKAQSE
ncbi:MAG: phasin family protein [Anaerolineales bacterium]|nr:phasin family protein [Anaerolineales bacterium]